MNYPYSNTILLLVSVYYFLVVLSIVHLIFRTTYTLTERLLWMVVLWVVPVLGLLAYWLYWMKRGKA